MNQPATNKRRMFSVVVGILLGTAAGAVPAYAAAPVNDSIAEATRLTTVPRVFVHDSSEATAHPSDGDCVEGASVWYRYRPTVTSFVRVVTFGSDYDTILAVFRGTRSNRTLLACNDDLENELFSLDSVARVRFVAGRTYFIAVSACCAPSARGGNGVLTMYRGRRAAVHTTIDSVESGEVSGRIFVHGTTTCATPAVAVVELRVSQRVGDHVARGSGSSGEVDCSSNGTSWRAAIDSETGWAFRQGTASVSADSFSDDGFSFVSAAQTQNATVGSSPNASSQASRR